MKDNKIDKTRRNLLFGLGATGGVAAIAAVGPYIGDFFNQQSSDTYTGKLTSLEEIRRAEPFDVCIIGSGPAGAILGIDLARQGVRTLILESGTTVQGLVEDDRIQSLHNAISHEPLNYPIVGSRYRALGGTSNIWTGRCSRLHPLDFEQHAYSSSEVRWPISYTDIQSYYKQAEETLRVNGGRLSKYHAPREGDTPLPAYHDFSLLAEMLSRVGTTIDPSPTSVSPNSKGPVRAAGDLLPEFTSLPGAVLASGLTVTRLVPDVDGNITEAEVKDLDHQSVNVKARYFVVATGAVEASRLLLLSKSDRFPHGIGNSNDQVGRYFTEHPNVDFNGLLNMPESEARWQFARCHQYYDEFKRQGNGSIIMVFTLRPTDMDAGVDGMVKTKLSIGATLEMEPVADNRITLSKSMKDYFGNPVADLQFNFSKRDDATISKTKKLIHKLYSDLGVPQIQDNGISWSHHHIGTCRMGEHETNSVTNSDLKVNGCSNLYIAGSAVFPTGGAAHPTLAIAAFSHRLAEHLAEKIKMTV